MSLSSQDQAVINELKRRIDERDDIAAIQSISDQFV